MAERDRIPCATPWPTSGSAMNRARLQQAARLWLQGSGVIANAIQAGEMVPDFRLPGADSTWLSLGDLLDRGPLVLLFTLGADCPECRRMLSAFSAVAADFEAARAHVIAISPDPPRVSGELIRDLRLKMPVLADADGRLRRLFGLNYAPPAPASLWFELLGLPTADPRLSDDLSLPAAYIVAPSGIATFAWLRADPLARAEPAAILAAIFSSR